MSEEQDVRYSPQLIEKDGSLHVIVSHSELDSLVGRLMQMCELTGDQEQRKALKDEIKNRTRSWLDDLYIQSGYQKHQLRPGARIVNLNAMDCPNGCGEREGCSKCPPSKFLKTA